MDLPLYNAKTLMRSNSPDEAYREHEQALINAYWDDTTQVYTVYEQEFIGGKRYNPIEVRVTPAIEMGTSYKQDDDFKHFAFKDLNHFVNKGRMFKYDDDFWITINTSELGTVTKDITVRRCNNVMRWIDPVNGALLEMPCVVEYVLQSPTPSKDKDVITANGHISVICQGNDEVKQIPKNKRFIFNGEPYKFVAIQKMLNEATKNSKSNHLFYLEMWMDMAQPDDDFDCGVANAGQYDYEITLESAVAEQVKGFSGQVFANVTLNGVTVDREVEFIPNYACQVDNYGNYTLTGESGEVAIIKAKIAGNDGLVAKQSIRIVDTAPLNKEIVINPIYTSVNQAQSIHFTVQIYQNGEPTDEEITILESGANKDAYSLIQNGNEITILAHKIDSIPLTLVFQGNGVADKTINLKLKSMF